MVGESGLAADSAFAGEKKKIKEFTAEVDFRIEVVKVIGVNNKRGFGKIWFSGVDKNGVTVDGVGTVFFHADGNNNNLPLADTKALVLAEVIVNTSKGVSQARISGILNDIVIDSGTTMPIMIGVANIVIDAIGAG